MGILLLLSSSLTAKSFHVTVDGSATGTGDINDAWTLQAALNQPFSVQPGDSILIHEGIYRGFFTSRLTGNASNPIIVTSFKRENVIIEGISDEEASSVLTIEGSFSHIQNLIIRSRNSNRVSTQSGSNPNDINTSAGVIFFGHNNKLINCIIHDNVGSGIGFWSTAVDSEIYGCIIFYNGWVGPDRGHGHAIYSQNETGTKKISNNIIFSSAGEGIHIYTEGGSIQGFDISSNILFNSGFLSGSFDRSIIIGGFQPADRIEISNNCMYHDFDISGKSLLQLGYGTDNVNGSVSDNYMAGGSASLAVVRPWEELIVSGNSLINPTNCVSLGSIEDYSGYSWDNNSYYMGILNGRSFSEWQNITGFDSNGSYFESLPDENKIFIYPNEYESRRAHIAIFNWEMLDTVEIDVSSFLAPGETFYLYDVENLQAGPFQEGKVQDSSISIEMNRSDFTGPYGNISSIVEHTGTDFGVFLVRGSGNDGNGDDIVFKKEKCYPNPTVDIFVIEFIVPNYENLRVDVFSQDGKSIHNEMYSALPGDNKVVLNLASLPVGVYIVVIKRADGRSISCKVIKNNFIANEATWINSKSEGD